MGLDDIHIIPNEHIYEIIFVNYMTNTISIYPYGFNTTLSFLLHILQCRIHAWYYSKRLMTYLCKYGRIYKTHSVIIVHVCSACTTQCMLSYLTNWISMYMYTYTYICVCAYAYYVYVCMIRFVSLSEDERQMVRVEAVIQTIKTLSKALPKIHTCGEKHITWRNLIILSVAQSGVQWHRYIIKTQSEWLMGSIISSRFEKHCSGKQWNTLFADVIVKYFFWLE